MKALMLFKWRIVCQAILIITGCGDRKNVNIGSCMKKLIIFILFAFTTSINAFSQTDSLLTVTALGVGKNEKIAKEEALRNAVEQVVGVYIDYQTKVKNYRLISDEILSYSDGFISNYKIIDSKIEGDLVKLTIKATVSQRKVEKKLVELQISEIDVDGESLFGEAFTKIDRNKKAVRILKDLFKDYPQSAYRVLIQQPKIINTSIKGKTQIELSYRIEWIPSYYQRVLDTYQKIGVSHLKKTKYSSYYSIPWKMKEDIFNEYGYTSQISIITGLKDNGCWGSHTTKLFTLVSKEVAGEVVPPKYGCPFYIHLEFKNKYNKTLYTITIEGPMNNLGIRWSNIAGRPILEIDFFPPDINLPYIRRVTYEEKSKSVINRTKIINKWIDLNILEKTISIEGYISSEK